MFNPDQPYPLKPDHSLSYVVTTNEQKAEVLLTEHAIHYRQFDRAVSFITHSEAIIFARLLMDRPNMPFLGSHLIALNQFEEEMTVSDRYKKLVAALGASSLREHFVHVGPGSATWYGFLPNNNKPEKFEENGKRILRANTLNKRRLNKGLKHFEAFAGYYADKKDPRFSKRQIVGAAMTTICIGGTYIFAKHQKRPMSE